jgi:hypothetical protein
MLNMNKLVTELFDAYLTKNPGATTSSKFGKNKALDPFVRTINGIKILTVYKAEHEFVKFAKENARNAEGTQLARRQWSRLAGWPECPAN